VLSGTLNPAQSKVYTNGIFHMSLNRPTSECERNLNVHVCLADNLAFQKPSLEITTVISADKGNDGLESTYSCTNDAEAFPWWAVDLEQEYYVSTVALTLPNAGADTCNYRHYCFIR